MSIALKSALLRMPKANCRRWVKPKIRLNCHAKPARAREITNGYG
jgi:hypothetical protein